MKRVVNILVMWVVAAMAAVAQTATVKSFGPALSDLTAQKYSRDDRNGVKCAVVKVQVIADNVQFQGGIIEPVEEKPGEYWVYMPAQEQRVLVMSKNFKPLMVEFGEPLQAGVTYVLDIEAPQIAGAVQPQKPRMSFLVLKVAPVTARVTIDGVAVPTDKGMVSKALPNGEHTYRVEELGYAPEEGTVTIDGKKLERIVTLRSNMPKLTVTTQTPGTEIFVNDISKGVGSWSGELYADSYVVEGRKQGHRPQSQSVTLGENEVKTIALPALEAITGSLSVDYKPIGAKISIDGKEVGAAPDVFDGLLMGDHTVVISADGYRSVKLTAQVTEGEASNLTGSLEEVPAIVEGEEKHYIPYEENGKYGYRYNGKTVILARYDEARPFYEGLALVVQNGKDGFIDKNGTMVIPAEYDNAMSFSEGLAGVVSGGRWGYIDKSGEMVIPAIYYDAYSFYEGLSGVKLDGKYGFIDKSGTMVIPAIYDDVYSFSEGLASVKLNGKRGWVDKSGNMVIPAKYDVAGEFHDGLALFKQNDKYGFIDKSGKIVIPAKYDDVWGFSEGLARVKLDGKVGFIDKNGTMVIPAEYDNAMSFSEGLAPVELNGKRGFIDKSGNMVIPAKYDIVHNFRNGKAKVKLNGRNFYIDKNGNEVGAETVASANGGGNAADAPAIVEGVEKNYKTFKKDGKYGFKYKGKTVIPAKYEYASKFGEGRAVVRLNGKYGFVDKDGNMAVPAEYDNAWPFSEGLAPVESKGKWGFVDRNGKLVIPAIYDGALMFSGGKSFVELNGKNFYIDKNGNTVEPAK